MRKDRLVFGQLFNHVKRDRAQGDEHDEDDQMNVHGQIVRGVEKGQTGSDWVGELFGWRNEN